MWVVEGKDFSDTISNSTNRPERVITSWELLLFSRDIKRQGGSSTSRKGLITRKSNWISQDSGYVTYLSTYLLRIYTRKYLIFLTYVKYVKTIIVLWAPTPYKCLMGWSHIIVRGQGVNTVTCIYGRYIMTQMSKKKEMLSMKPQTFQTLWTNVQT